MSGDQLKNSSAAAPAASGSSDLTLRDFSSISHYISWEREHFYNKVFPLSAKYPLVGIEFIVAAQIIYALIVLWGVSRKRADKKPLIADGRWLLRVYNTAQVILSGYLAYLAVITYLRKVIFQGSVCQPMKVSINADPEEYELETYTCWLFYISKWVDYMDTIFIVTRSKWRQLSFLHTFHHSSMIFLTWLATHYHPCGYFLIAIQLNAPVHFVMYFYYLCSSFPSLTPYLWWKNYITTIQLLQFVTGTVVTTVCFCKQALGYISGLSYFFVFIFILYGLTLFSLFYAFYRNTYKSSGRKSGGGSGSADDKSASQKKSKKDL